MEEGQTGYALRMRRRSPRGRRVVYLTPAGRDLLLEGIQRPKEVPSWGDEAHLFASEEEAAEAQRRIDDPQIPAKIERVRVRLVGGRPEALDDGT